MNIVPQNRAAHAGESGFDEVFLRAEVFSTIREAYEIPRDDALKLRDYPTLAHVIGFVRERAAARVLGTVEPEPSSAAAASSPAAAQDDWGAAQDDQQFPRRIVGPILRPSLSQCKPTAVALGAGRRIVDGRSRWSC